jgi:hypothetical protein
VIWWWLTHSFCREMFVDFDFWNEIFEIVFDFGMTSHHICHIVGDLQTPLHQAANDGHTEVAKLLIKHGADVNIKEVSNMTWFVREWLWLNNCVLFENPLN